MAENAGHILDVPEETLSRSNRIQPLSSTQMSEARKIDHGEKKHTSLTLGERLGLEDLLSLNVWRASVGELLGTAVLVFALDTIVISSYETETKMPNLLLSVLVAFIVTVMLLAVLPISGGHMNPAISFSAALVGFISLSRAAIYIVAQCLGAVLGALALKAVVSSSIADKFSLVGCTISVVTSGPNGPVTVGLEASQALWLEILCTFVLLFASVWIAYDHRQAKVLGPVTVCSIIGIVMGLLVFISTTVTTQKGYAGAGLNPARCLGPAVVIGGHLWNGLWVFWVGPAISCFAFYLYTKIIPSQHFHWDGYKHDFFYVLKAMARPS